MPGCEKYWEAPNVNRKDTDFSFINKDTTFKELETKITEIELVKTDCTIIKVPLKADGYYDLVR